MTDPNIWQDTCVPMSRCAAAAAASLTIANMLALENQIPYSNWYILQMKPSAAVPQPLPSTVSKEKKPKGLFKSPAFLPSINSLPLPPSLMEGTLTFDYFAPVGGTNPFTPTTGVKLSDASSMMGKLFQSSLPVNEDMQSMKSMTDTDVLALLGMSCLILIPYILLNSLWIVGSQWTQFQQNLSVDLNFGQMPSTLMDAANQQPATHVLALSDANNNQATLPLQLDKIGRLGSPSDQKDRFKV